jgi:FkbM family methyltransferase
MAQFLKNLAAKTLGIMGLRLHRISPQQGSDPGSPPAFYKPSPSCQIPELASLYSLYLGERSDGLFVEVGAFDGISYSNSSCLADAGWKGILIEPISEFAITCKELYSNNERIKIVETAIGDSNGMIDIAIAGPLTTVSSTLLESYKAIAWAKSVASSARTISVSQRTLDDVLGSMATPKPFDVLIVDVEGAEGSVFKGFTFEIWRPKMIIVELVHTHPDLHAISSGDADLQKIIQSQGYSVAYKDKINTVFVL